MVNTPIQSPCIKVCAVDGKTGLCLGCGRTLPEIGTWARLDDAGRESIMTALPERLETLKQMGKR